MLEKNRPSKEELFDTDEEGPSLTVDKAPKRKITSSQNPSKLIEQSPPKKTEPVQQPSSSIQAQNNTIPVLQGTGFVTQLGKLMKDQPDPIICRQSQSYKKYSDRLQYGGKPSDYSQQNLLFGNMKRTKPEGEGEIFIVEGSYLQGEAKSPGQPADSNLNVSKIKIESKNFSQIGSHKKNGVSQVYVNNSSSYSVSPKFLSEIQSRVQLLDFSSSHQPSKPAALSGLNSFKQIADLYPLVLADAHLTEEARQILQHELKIDVLTIEILMSDFEKHFKDDLVHLIGSDVLKLLQPVPDKLLEKKYVLSTTQENSSSHQDPSLPDPDNFEETKSQQSLERMDPKDYPPQNSVERKQRSGKTASLIPITNNSHKNKAFTGQHMNGDISDLVKVNQLEGNSKKIVSQIKSVTSQKQNQIQNAWQVLFRNKNQGTEQTLEGKDELVPNLNIISKYSVFYTALKQKYNMCKKKHPQSEYSFVATRDTSIIKFILTLHKQYLIKSPLVLLKNIANILLVIKSNEDNIPSKNHQQNQNKFALNLEGAYLKHTIQSPKPYSKIIGGHDASKVISNEQSQFSTERTAGYQVTRLNQQQIIASKRASSTVSNLYQIQSFNSGIQGSTIFQNSSQSSLSLKEQKHSSQKAPPTLMKVIVNESDSEDPPKQPVEAPKIKIWHQKFEHLRTHPVNKAFKIYNEFISLTFKNRLPQLNQARIFQLSKIIGLQIQSKTQLTEGLFRNKETALPIKEKLYFFLIQTIASENSISLSNQPSSPEQIQQTVQGYYKYFVGLGNNSLMVRNVMKQRWWWYLNNEKADFDDVNFIWTQWRKHKISNQLLSFKDMGPSEENAQMQNEMNGSIGNNSMGGTPSTSSQSVKNMKNGSQYQSGKKARKSGIEAVVGAAENKSNQGIKLYNKIENNFHLSNKKALFLNMRNYYEALNQDLSDALPLTFHIKKIDDAEFSRFKSHFLQVEEQNQSKTQNIWIIKPGENTNRGHGIEVRKDLTEIIKLIESYSQNERTVIVQKYISNPLLINKRKFDIRCYALITSVKGQIKAYFYRDGYIRTSCKEFSLNNLNNRMIHLTNDAVQKYSDDYGKYEPGNKMSYEDFQKYISSQPNFQSLKVDMNRDIVPQIQKLVTDTIRATYHKIDPFKRANTFEIFGYDFMIDDQFKIYLIEANTNPCLELSSPLLAKIIPHMVENSFRIGIDPLFPPPEGFVFKKSMMMTSGEFCCQENKFELIFDEKVDGPMLSGVITEKEKVISKSWSQLLVEIDEEEHGDDSDVD